MSQKWHQIKEVKTIGEVDHPTEVNLVSHQTTVVHTDFNPMGGDSERVGDRAGGMEGTVADTAEGDVDAMRNRNAVPFSPKIASTLMTSGTMASTQLDELK